MRRSKHALGAMATFLLLAAGMLALAQAQTATPSTLTVVGYVYVATPTSSSTTQAIHAYTAWSNGTLTAISGQPFSGHVGSGATLALNGKWLFTTDGIKIYSRLIHSNGSLGSGPYVNAQQRNEYPTDGGPLNLVLDHTGASLYDGDIYIDGSNSGYQAWNINQTTGALAFNGLVPPYSPDFGQPLSFAANNVYAYSASCFHGTQDVYGYKRSSTGMLTSITTNAPFPASPVSGSEYCPWLAAADPTNHLAVSLTPFVPYQNAGPPQIAVYTIQSNGTLTGSNTATNMPKTKVVQVNDLKMSPSGKLLAVAGSGGLQVLHWNGGSPATAYTGLLTTSPINQVFWDTHNHLYAISNSAQKLYVFTVTPTSVSQASGSPRSLPHPISLVVLPK